MLTIELQKFELDHEDAERVYFKNLSHGLEMNDKNQHRHIWWIGLWFYEIRLCWFRQPN